MKKQKITKKLLKILRRNGTVLYDLSGDKAYLSDGYVAFAINVHDVEINLDRCRNLEGLCAKNFCPSKKMEKGDKTGIMYNSDASRILIEIKSASYISYINKKYDDLFDSPEYFLTGNLDGVLLKESDKTVGVIMPVRFSTKEDLLNGKVQGGQT